jgi:hypothetical protein
VIETVRELIPNNRLIILRILEEELETSRETVRSILVGDLGKRKMCSRFVMPCLTDKQKAGRLQVCQEFMQSVYDDRSLLDSIVTGDEI